VASLDPEDVVDVASALARLLPALPADAQRPALDALLAPPLRQLHCMLPDASLPLEAPRTPGPGANCGALAEQLDRVAALLRHAGCPDAVAACLASPVWPLVRASLLAVDDERCCDRACRCLKYGLRSAGAQRCGGLLADIGLTIGTLFRRRRAASLLFAASELVREFAGAHGAAQHLQPLLAQLFADACEALPDPPSLAARPDVADDLFLLAGKALKHFPVAVFSQPALASLLSVAASGACTAHREAAESALSFLASLLRLRHGADTAQAQMLAASLAQGGGLRVAHALLAAALVLQPRQMLADVADALTALLFFAREAALGWLQAAVGRLPEQEVPRVDLQPLAAAAAAAAAGEACPPLRAMAEALDELAQVCRRNRRAFEGCHLALTGEAMLPPPPPRA
jgi:transportin-3